MRTLIALVVLVVALAYAVVYKTSNTDGQPPTQLPHDNSIGIMTLGATSDEAASPADPESKAVEAVSESTNSDVNIAPTATKDIAVHEPMPPTLQPETVTETENSSIAEAGGAIDYVVRKDDTMYRIIKNHYGTYSEDILRAISDANNLSDPSDIGIGDKVTLPVIEGVGAPKRR
jgi:LysM repeat protein